MNIIITGASGLVATELTLTLLKSNKPLRLTLVSRAPQELLNRYSNSQSLIKYLTIEELINDNSESYDICIHTAFARSSSGDKIAESLDYTTRLCKWIKERKIPRFVNISSQSVYGNSYEPFVKEEAPCKPDYMYALAKYSSELIVKGLLEHSDTKIINIRLSSVCENARFLRIFVENVICHRPIELTAPNQVVSFIDVRDVALALSQLIFSSDNIPGDYNLGSGQNYTILEVSQLIDQIGSREFQLPKVDIIINDKGNNSRVGMSIDKFCTTYHWAPQYNIGDMIRSLYEMLINANGGGYPESFKLLYLV